jgi:hypothetical protein
MLQNIFEEIDFIIYNNYNINNIFDEIIKIFSQFEPDYINELVEDYIDNNYNKLEKMTFDYGIIHPFYKFILYRSRYVDIFTIKWTKNSTHKFNIGNKQNYIMFTINDGKLHQHLFKKSNIFNKYIHKMSDRFYLGEYIVVEKNCIHRVKAEEYTETLHVVIYM